MFLVFVVSGILIGFAISHMTRDRGPPAWIKVIQLQLNDVESDIYHLTRLAKASQQLVKEELVTLAELKSKVESEGTVVSSAVTLLGGLSQQLKDALANGDTAAIQAIADEVDAQRDSLAAAVAANTIAESAPSTPGTAQSTGN